MVGSEGPRDDRRDSRTISATNFEESVSGSVGGFPHYIEYPHGQHLWHNLAMDSLLFYAAYTSANNSLLKEITTLLQSSVYEKPIVCCFPSPKGIWIEEKRQLVESGATISPTPERAAKVLVRLARRSQIISSLKQP